MRKTRALRPFQACVVIAMLPAPLLGQLTLTSHNPPPSVCRDEQNNLKADVIRVETNPGNPFVGRYARFNNSAYELRLYVCASDAPGGCGNIRSANWKVRPTVCKGGESCEGWLISLARARPVTVYFVAFIFDRAHNRAVTTTNDTKPVFRLNWKDIGPCPKQPQPRTGGAARTVNLLVNGASCSTAGSERANDVVSTVSPQTAVIRLPANHQLAVPIQIHAEMHNWGPAWHLEVGGLGVSTNFRVVGNATSVSISGPGAPAVQCSSSESCDITLRWMEERNGSTNGEVTVGTAYDDKLGPRDPTGKDRVLAQAECKVPVRFVH